MIIRIAATKISPAAYGMNASQAFIPLAKGEFQQFPSAGGKV